jgi:hypothetical protein
MVVILAIKEQKRSGENKKSAATDDENFSYTDDFEYK